MVVLNVVRLFASSYAEVEYAAGRISLASFFLSSGKRHVDLVLHTQKLCRYLSLLAPAILVAALRPPFPLHVFLACASRRPHGAFGRRWLSLSSSHLLRFAVVSHRILPVGEFWHSVLDAVKCGPISRTVCSGKEKKTPSNFIVHVTKSEKVAKSARAKCVNCATSERQL